MRVMLQAQVPAYVLVDLDENCVDKVILDDDNFDYVYDTVQPGVGSFNLVDCHLPRALDGEGRPFADSELIERAHRIAQSVEWPRWIRGF